MTVLGEDLHFIGRQLTETERQFYQDGVILITGCAGSLGYELTHYLLRCSGARRVIGIDNCHLGFPNWLRRLEADQNFQFCQADIATVSLGEIPGIEHVTHVFHMASVASPVSYREDPLATMDANVNGCRNLLEFFKDRPLKTFCYFSSSEIYGSPDGAHLPTPESFWGSVSCVGPRACYDEAKRYSETLCQVFAQKYGVPCVILRPFNIFGPGMKLNDRRIPADCAEAIVKNRDIPIYSDGTPTRTFCYVADAIVWILKAAAVGAFDLFNIGTAAPELSISAFAQIFVSVGREKFGYRGNLVFMVSADPDYLTHNPRRRCPDLTYAQEKLCYQPQVSTWEGVARFLQFFHDEFESGQLEEEWAW